MLYFFLTHGRAKTIWKHSGQRTNPSIFGNGTYIIIYKFHLFLTGAGAIYVINKRVALKVFILYKSKECKTIFLIDLSVLVVELWELFFLFCKQYMFNFATSYIRLFFNAYLQMSLLKKKSNVISEKNNNNKNNSRIF